MTPMFRRAVLRALPIAALSTLFVASTGTAMAADTLHGLDTDADGTIDLAEAKQAASAKFDALDKDHDGTLSARELKGRLTAPDLKSADPDADRTLTKDEYLALVEKRFKAADPDGDGKLDARELATPAGRALQRLVR